MLAGFDDGLEEPFLARFEADGDGLLFIARLNNALVFADGFESGDHAAWSRSVP